MASRSLFHVFLGFPFLCFPWGLQVRFWRLMLVGGFLRVCPIHLHFCFVISSFTSSSPVLCQRSLLLMVSGQKILDIFQRQQLNIRVNNEILEQVDTFKYLGIQIKNDLRTDKELETRENSAPCTRF